MEGVCKKKPKEHEWLVLFVYSIVECSLNGSDFAVFTKKIKFSANFCLFL